VTKKHRPPYPSEASRNVYAQTLGSACARPMPCGSFSATYPFGLRRIRLRASRIFSTSRRTSIDLNWAGIGRSSAGVGTGCPFGGGAYGRARDGTLNPGGPAPFAAGSWFAGSSRNDLSTSSRRPSSMGGRPRRKSFRMALNACGAEIPGTPVPPDASGMRADTRPVLSSQKPAGTFVLLTVVVTDSNG